MADFSFSQAIAMLVLGSCWPQLENICSTVFSPVGYSSGILLLEFFYHSAMLKGFW